MDLERFRWVSSDFIEELELHAISSSNSLSGLTSLSKCQKLKALTLDLKSSQVSDLTPLEQLKNLTELTLDLSRFGGYITKLTDLEKLGNLPQLHSALIKGATTEQRKSLRKIPASLVELKF